MFPGLARVGIGSEQRRQSVTAGAATVATLIVHLPVAMLNTQVKIRVRGRAALTALQRAAAADQSDS